MGLLKKTEQKPKPKPKVYEYIYHQIALDPTAYEIVCKVKNQLIIKHKRPFNFSDAIRELNARGERR